jgi:hypothetical protein
MLKRLTPLLTLLLGLAVCYGFMAAKAPLAGKQYDYVTLIQSNNELQISTPPDKYEKINLKLSTNVYESNYGPLFAKVNELEAQGYELVNSNVFARGGDVVSRNYVLLRRPRQ